MFEVDGRVSVAIYINETELVFDRANVLDFLSIACSTQLSLPILHFVYRDSGEWLIKKGLLAEGARITVSLSKSGKPAKTYAFILNSYKERQESEQLVYSIDGYLAFPKFWIESTQQQFEGTSSAALSNIADLCSFPADKQTIDSTSDTQVWLPRNQRYHVWAKDIAKHGYTSEQGCMQLGVDVDGAFMYKDVTKKQATKHKFGLALLDSEMILVTSYEPHANSGTLNKLTGYQSMLIEQLPLSNDPFRNHRRLDVNSSTKGSVSMSGKVRSQVERGRVSVGPISAGNENEHYQRGAYQNQRMSNLFSVGLNVLTPFVTDVRLMDPVEFIAPTNRSYLKQYSTSYIVSAHTIVVNGIDYMERFELLSYATSFSDGDAPESETGDLTETNNFDA